MTKSNRDKKTENYYHAYTLGEEIQWLVLILQMANIPEKNLSQKLLSIFGSEKKSEDHIHWNQNLDLALSLNERFKKIHSHRDEKLEEKERRDIQNQLNAFYLKIAEEFIAGISSRTVIVPSQLANHIKKLNENSNKFRYQNALGLILGTVLKLHSPEFLTKRGLTFSGIKHLQNVCAFPTFLSFLDKLNKGPEQLFPEESSDLITAYFQKELHCSMKPYVKLQHEDVYTLMLLTFENKDDFNEAQSRLQIGRGGTSRVVQHSDFSFATPVSVEFPCPKSKDAPFYLTLRIPTEHYSDLLDNFAKTLRGYWRGLST